MEIRKCEICGQTFVAGYGYSIVLNWLVTGHAYVRAYLCETAGPSGQHWGCSPDHAIEAVKQCLDKHMHADALREKHAASDKPRYSEGDAKWAKEKGENFHHVQIIGNFGE